MPNLNPMPIPKSNPNTGLKGGLTFKVPFLVEKFRHSFAMQAMQGTVLFLGLGKFHSQLVTGFLIFNIFYIHGRSYQALRELLH